MTTLHTGVTPLFPADRLAERVAELGKTITRDYAGASGELVVVCVLKGSFVFAADLARGEVLEEGDRVLLKVLDNAMRSRHLDIVTLAPSGGEPLTVANPRMPLDDLRPIPDEVLSAGRSGRAFSSRATRTRRKPSFHSPGKPSLTSSAAEGSTPRFSVSRWLDNSRPVGSPRSQSDFWGPCCT